MKNKGTILLVVLGVLMIPLACSRNFLNPPDTQGTNASSLFHTPQDGISLVNSIYDGFQHDNQNFVLKGLCTMLTIPRRISSTGVPTFPTILIRFRPTSHHYPF